jgi:murein L,D-transpeptidase YafK
MKPARFISGAFALCVLQLFAYDRAHAQLVDDSRFDAGSAGGSVSFVQEQLRFTRVREARVSTEDNIKRLYHQRHLRYPAAEVYLRVFKLERTLEVWVRPADRQRFELLTSYRICALAGGVGPKRRQGDHQVPEGFYNVDLFNPASAYHLSMRIDYPNRHDLKSNRGQKLGGDIFIHGGCLSEGCLAITNEGIQELYWIALTARGLGQRKIPVHIFPARFGSSWDTRPRKGLAHVDANVMDFWKSLKPGYYYFERNRRVPQMTVDARGRYRLGKIFSAD